MTTATEVKSAPAVKQAAYTDEQVAKVMETQSVNRIGAIHLIRRMGYEKAVGFVKETPAQKVKPVKAAKAKTTKGKTKGEPREAKYSKEAVIKAWDRGLRPSEIAELETHGIKGISSIYVGRILFGCENSGGISPDQAKRRKEEAKRRDERSKGDKAVAK
jgi:hypothetical protein